jgi:hypothetical protein
MATGNFSYFNIIDSYDKAYFLGFIAGDGALVYNKDKKGNNYKYPYLTITLHAKDLYVLEALKKALNYSGNIYRVRNDEHVRLVVCSQELSSALMLHGISPNKSLTMGNIIEHVPYDYRNAFILGYFDADGSCCVRETKYFSKRSSEFKTSIKQSVQIRGTVAFLQGIVTHLQLKTYHISTKDSIAKLAISSKEGFTKFFNKVYGTSSVYLARKYEKFLPIISKDQTISSSENSELGARVPIIA